MGVESDTKSGEINKSNASDQAGIKNNVLEQKYFCFKYFWEALGDVTGKDVLDLACGSGHFTRGIKEKGANLVVGVDISEKMIKEARTIDNDEPLGINYFFGDVSSYMFTFSSESPFDIVTGEYILCYAESLKELKQYCLSAFNNLKPEGGRFTTITGVLDGAEYLQDPKGDFYYELLSSETKEAEEGAPWCDGCLVQITVVSEDKKSKCTFPNYCWKFETIRNALLEVGFNSVEVYEIDNKSPVMIISAIKCDEEESEEEDEVVMEQEEEKKEADEKNVKEEKDEVKDMKEEKEVEKEGEASEYESEWESEWEEEEEAEEGD